MKNHCKLLLLTLGWALLPFISGCQVSDVNAHGFPFDLFSGRSGSSYSVMIVPSSSQRVKVGERIFFTADITDKDGDASPPDSWYVIGGIGSINGGFFLATTVGVGYVVVKKGSDTAQCRIEVY